MNCVRCGERETKPNHRLIGARTAREKRRMMQRTRAAAWGLTLGAILAVGGCQSGPGANLKTSTAALVEDLQPLEPEARLARMQRGDLPTVPPPVATAGLPTVLQQKTMVRAYVNGNPIFDHEVLNVAVPRLRGRGPIKQTEMLEVQAKVYTDALEELIDQEVVFQEAVRRLEKSNAAALVKLKNIAEQEVDKRLREIQERGEKYSPEVMREQIPMMRRHMERSLIFSEYLRSRVRPGVESRVGLTEINDYYQAHKSEYVRVETVEWQDVFLAVGPKYPTLADARRAAEDMIARVRTTEDFAKLIPYDDGDSKFRGGKGFGKRRGEIRPAELEEYLFKMRNGEIGPVVELSSGVHIFRLVERQAGGQTPLNEELQKQIRVRLHNQLFEKEARSIIRELRGRSVIEIEGR